MSANSMGELSVLVETLPFPLAFVLREDVFEAPTAHQRAIGLIRVAERALHYAALVAASDYAAAQFKDERVSHSLDGLKRPLTSHFASFLRAAVPRLAEQGALFVP